MDGYEQAFSPERSEWGSRGGRLTIGELARLAHTTPKTVRYYERIGLLPPAKRGDNQYRYYEAGQVHRLRFIRRAQRLGLTLAEIE